MKTKTLLVTALAFSIPTSFVLAEASSSMEKPAKTEKKGDKKKFEDVTVDELKAAVDAGTVTVIDANGAKSYESGHVPGALEYGAIKDDLAASLPKDKDALIVAYCGSPKCGAWKKAAVAAKKLGYTNVKHMSAGIKGWKDAGQETE
ncbi:rhodanese-like domain-containing protein [Rubritalea spongiae]|uniref:Rhodanese-like domain-containing protein n=1 Tax=Rubritalea spongiae TaxID=430797 RepID=A0ABW5E836_9BACT